MGTTFTPGSNSRGDPAQWPSIARVPHVPHPYHFGPFEFRRETGELWKHGVRLRLQSKPAQMLETLLEHPGELVTREMIRQKLWPEGTYVDFEGGINTATNRLRAVLADCPDNPTYIETIPRLGYRFIYPLPELAPSSLESSANPPLAPAELTPLRHTAPGLAAFSRPMIIAAAFASVVLIAGLAALNTVKLTKRTVEPEFHQLTFRPDNIASARFMPNSKSVAYTELMRDGVRQTSVIDTGDLQSHLVEAVPGLLTAVSHKGDLMFVGRGGKSADRRLFQVEAATHTSKTLDANAVMADSSPIDSEFAIVRHDGSASVLEFPNGHSLFRSRGWISDLRVAPSADRVAFLEHPVRDDDAGYVRMVDRKGVSSRLTPLWSSAVGLAWSPSGAEIWFSASKDGATRAIYAVSGAGKVRLVFQSPSSLRVLDFAPSGKLLVALDDERLTLFTGGRDAAELDASQFDCSHADGMSADGTLLLFTECGNVVGQHYTSYIRNLKTAKTTFLSSGRALDLSADGQWAITIDPQDRKSLTLHHSSSPDFRVLSGNGLEYQWAKFLPGGEELLVGGSFAGDQLRIYRQTIRDGHLREARGLDYMDDVMISRVDTKLAGLISHQMRIFDWSNGKLLSSSQLESQLPVGWSADGQTIYSMDLRKLAIVKLDLCSGRTEDWRSIRPYDTGGFSNLAAAVAAPEAGAYAYSARFSSSRLYLVSGLS